MERTVITRQWLQQLENVLARSGVAFMNGSDRDGLAGRQVYYYCDEAVWGTLPLDIREKACVYKGYISQGVNNIQVAGKGKGLKEVEHVWEYLYNKGAMRSSVLVCIGGGTVSDIGGFAASTYKRGLRYVNVPTTLLSMVDASVGGKTGFNYMGVKNLIGTFSEPLETIVDVGWLESLPNREYLSGYAEMVKHGLIGDSEYFYHLLSTNIDEDIENKVKRSIEIKSKIVEYDPRESGRRKVLNFGHTIGHALEAQSIRSDKQEVLPHGYAIMYGMVAELYLSVVVCGMDREVLRMMSHYMLENYGRPVCGCQDYDKLLSLMKQDKKNEREGEVCFTLLKGVGEPTINEVVDERLIREALEYLFSL